MLTYTVQRVSGTSGTPKFVDDTPEHATVKFPGRHISDQGADKLSHAFTLQSQGWRARSDVGLPGADSHPPTVRVVRVPGAGIEIDDTPDALTYEIGKELILTDAGACGLQKAIQARVRHWLRLRGPVGYVRPSGATD